MIQNLQKMKTNLTYIIAILGFIICTNPIYAQDIDKINPDPACAGEVVIVTGSKICGLTKATTYIELDGANISANITAIKNQANTTKDTIWVQLPYGITGTVVLKTKKDGNGALGDDYSLAIATPNVTLITTAGTTICQGDSKILTFTVTNAGATNSVIITYFENGVLKTKNVVGNGAHTLSVSPTVNTVYSIVSIANVTGCTNLISNQSVTLTVAPPITGTLTTSNATICSGNSTDLIFNINNPEGDSMLVTYKIDGITSTFLTTSTTHTLSQSPTATTIYELVKIKNITKNNCEANINATQTITVGKFPNVTLTNTGTPDICLTGSTTLKFLISNKTNPTDKIKIKYSDGGISKNIEVYANDTTITVAPSATTTYTLISAENLNISCTTALTGSQTVTVAPAITGTLAASDNVICKGEVVSLFFSANNPNGDNLIFHYTDGSSNFSKSTSGNFVAHSISNLNATTTFTLNSIENVTTSCTKNITTNNTTTITVNNNMGATLAVNPTSVCQGESYDLTFQLTGRNLNDGVSLTYSKTNASFLNSSSTLTTNSSDQITVPQNEITSTIYSLISIENTTTGCLTTFSPSPANSTQITVTPVINASISTSNATICEGSSTNLIFSVANPNSESIKLFYSDGVNTQFLMTTSTTATLSIIPTVTTTYQLIKVQTTACEYTIANSSVQITVNKVPSVTIGGGGIACNGTAVSIDFSITNKTNVSDLMTVQYLSSGTLQSLSTTGTTISQLVTPPATTVYPLVSVTNNTVGCSNFNVSGTATVTVGSGLSAAIQASKNEICLNESITLSFIINGLSGQTRLIYSDGTTQHTLLANSATTTVIVSPTFSTIYTLLSVTDVTTNCGGNITTSSQTIAVNSLPQGVLIGGATICNQDAATLDFSLTSGTPPYNVTYKETKNGVISYLNLVSNNSTNISITPDVDVTYSLTSLTDSKGCQDPDLQGSAIITVNPLPIATFSLSDNTICKEEVAQLTFSVTNNENQNVAIYYTKTKSGLVTPDSIITDGTAILNVSPDLTTIYEVTGFRNKITNCFNTPSSSLIHTLTVNPLPQGTLVGGATICNQDTTTLAFNLSGGTPPYTVTYSETKNGITNNLNFVGSNSLTLNVTPNVDVAYRFTNLTDSKGCQDATLQDSAVIIVNPLPNATFSLNDNMICRGDIVQLTFSVSNNENQNVSIYYTKTKNNVVTQDSVITNGTVTLNISPDSTTTYQITGFRNNITNCFNTPTGNLIHTLTVNQLPKVIAQVSANTVAVCNGSNAAINFTFPVGLPPFSVYYADSFSNASTRTPGLTPWNNLTTGASAIELQNNSTSTTLPHIYFITKVVDGLGCITNYSINNEPSVNVNVYATPVVSINGVQPTSIPYASTDNAEYILTGTPFGGTFIGAGVGITLPSPPAYSYAKFIPANAGFLPTDTVRDITITYTFTSNTGCVATSSDTARLRKALKYKFYNEGSTILDTVYCRNAESINIFGKIDGTQSLAANTFVLDANNSVVLSNVQSFGDSVRVTLTPLNATGTFYLKFGSIATGFVTKQFTIIDTIYTLFSPNIDSAYLCQDFSERTRLTGIPSLDVQNSNGVFTSPTQNIIEQDNSNSINKGWYLKQHISGWHKILYTYTDVVTGCITRAVQNVRVAPKPVADLSFDVTCNDQDVTFTNNTTFTSATNLDTIKTFYWDFGNAKKDTTYYSNGFLNASTLAHDYGTAGVFTAQLKVISALGCEDIYNTTVIVGTKPNMDFSWRFATLGNDTEFLNETTPNNVAALGTTANYIDSLKWTFGDGQTSGLDTITSVGTVTHEYTNTGIYTAQLYARTNNGCWDTTSTKVYILPKVDSYPYYERFENSNGEWVAEPNLNLGNNWSWEHPNKPTIKHDNPQKKAWVTNIDTVIYAHDFWVYSPEFDFSTIEKPMIAFSYWSDARVSDGAVLQYSIDSAATWKVLGELETGLNWYKVSNLVAQPGDQSGFEGFAWTEKSNDWKVARHKLDELKGESAVRFRIAFAKVTGSSNGFDGFAFDDFFVGDRQKMVLIENFTNTGLSNYSTILDNTYQQLEQNDLDIVAIEYHNALPGNDAFNLFNPADPSGRALYYQFSVSGKTVIDGKVYNTNVPNTTNLAWTQKDLDLQILEEPAFNISIDNFAINNNTNTLSVTTSIKARKPLPSDLRKVYIAVVENGLTLDGKIHKKVLRKMLPSNGGTTLTNDWAIGTTQTVTMSWAFDPALVNAANLEVVIWIQDNDTKKVYQMAYSDLPNIPYDSTVVNTKPLETTQQESLQLFPNPNNGDFTIAFAQPISTNAQWQLVDISGRTVAQGEIAKFTENTQIYTQGLAQGLYFFKLYFADGRRIVEKVLVE